VESLDLIDVIPDPVDVPPELLEKCRASGDFREILFRYYRNVAILATICGNIQFGSPMWSGGSQRLWVVLAGLLTRVQRNMAGHLEYFQDDRYGDLTQILDRCLLETCVKIRWISADRTEERLRRYFEDSLRADNELFQEIHKNILARGGVANNIELRMLRSIEHNVISAGMTLNELGTSRKLPPLSTLISDIGEMRFIYTVVGKISSHAVHGTWANLLYCYLEGDDIGSMRPATAFPPPHINQYVMNCLFVLDALKSYLSCNFIDSGEREYLIETITSHHQEIMDLYAEVVGEDFGPAPEAQ
jgi:hypothetical protein